MPGTLTVCATPIGNLEDITFRALRALREADFIAAEDTRHTLQLLNHFEIRTPLISYHEHNKHERGPALLARLQAGENAALVSDAGMPGISDPGADLIRLCIDNDVSVTACPGASAGLMAAVLSGLDCGRFVFEGFLPHGRGVKKDRAQRLASLVNESRTFVLYESPRRLLATLAELLATLGDRPAAAARELTKRFEDVQRGTLSSLLSHFQETEPRGEFALVVAGAQIAEASHPAAGCPLSPAECVKLHMQNGLREMDAIKAAAKDLGLPKREVYAAVKILGDA